MKSRAIVTAWHKYTPFGHEFYQPMFDFFVQQMEKYKDEYDKIYFLDSTWNFTDDDYEKMKKIKGGIIKVNPSFRYYDAYKEVLPQIKEDVVLFMDNDMVVYNDGIIDETFSLIEIGSFDVVSIYDTIGTYKTDKLNGKNKFCPYWFATRKNLLMDYRDVEWAPNMPEHETLGKLTEKMLDDGVRPYEWDEDKSSLLFDGTQQYPEQHKEGGLGYYHIRSGSVPAYLLATKKYGDKKTYDDYLKNQPQSEYLRQMAWYYTMYDNAQWHGKKEQILEVVEDAGVNWANFLDYWHEFRKYHGL